MSDELSLVPHDGPAENMILTRESSGYQEFLEGLKERIKQAQVRATLSVNRELVLLYWHIGREILLRQNEQGWGAGVVNRLARDLRAAFPSIKGLSRRNLQYMRAFAEAYPDESIVHQVGAQLPWRHNVHLLDTVKDPEIRQWYAEKTIENGWSRAILMHQVESDLYSRQGKALTNFTSTLPAPDSELVREMLKDPYNFDFLTLTEKAVERDVELGLLSHITAFMMELGKGFAFVGQQYPLEVAGQAFRLDLLFYHLHLRRYIVIDLKIAEFKPEYAGKMNFYLAAIDEQLRHESDGRSLGIILCKSKNDLIVGYSLRDISTPIAVSDYLVSRVPDQLVADLPTVEEIQEKLSDLKSWELTGDEQDYNENDDD